MKYYIICFFLFCTIQTFAQSVKIQKTSIDSIVASIEAKSKKSEVNFSIVAMKKIKHEIRYKYKTANNQIIKIERSFGRGNDSATQVFYFEKNKLIYSTEQIVYATGTDNISGWGGTYYFANNKLIDMVTLGHGKSESEEWDPQMEVLQNCREAKNDIARYNKTQRTPQ